MIGEMLQKFIRIKLVACSPLAEVLHSKELFRYYVSATGNLFGSVYLAELQSAEDRKNGIRNKDFLYAVHEIDYIDHSVHNADDIVIDAKSMSFAGSFTHTILLECFSYDSKGKMTNWGAVLLEEPDENAIRDFVSAMQTDGTDHPYPVLVKPLGPINTTDDYHVDILRAFSAFIAQDTDELYGLN